MPLFRSILLAALCVTLTTTAAFAGKFCAGDRPSDLQGRNVQDNSVISLADLEGKWVLVDFFATWCKPCMAELPNLVDTTSRYRGERFEVLAVSLDNEQTVDKLRPVMREHGITFPLIHNGGGWEAAEVKEWGVQAIPDNYLISPQGVILMQGLHGEQLGEALDKVLNHQGALTPICVTTKGELGDGVFNLDINFNNPLAAKSECKLEVTYGVMVTNDRGFPEMDYQTSEQPLVLENPEGWETSTSLQLPLPAGAQMVYYKLSVYHPQLEMWVGFDGYAWPPRENVAGGSA